MDLVCPKKGDRYHVEWKVSRFLCSMSGKHFMHGGVCFPRCNVFHFPHIIETHRHVCTHTLTDSFEF